MKKRVAFIGIVLVAFGVIIYAIFSSIISSQTIAVNESFTVLAGSNVPSSFHLPNDADVSGTINQVTGQSTNDIDFYVFDRANYQVWANGGQSSVWTIKIFRATSGATFNFRTAEDDYYYFVFDNPGFCSMVKEQSFGLVHMNINPMDRLPYPFLFHLSP